MSDKKFFILAVIITVIVVLVVVILNILPKSDFQPGFVIHLPLLNACLNGTCTVLLLFSLYFIKRKKIQIHKKINITAFLLSSVFLVSYILFHFFVEETKFPVDNPIRPLYLCILTSHIFLAGVVLPLVLISFYFGLKMEVAKHKKFVRWSYPIWLYVTITGVIVYLMISPYYQF